MRLLCPTPTIPSICCLKTPLRLAQPELSQTTWYCMHIYYFSAKMIGCGAEIHIALHTSSLTSSLIFTSSLTSSLKHQACESWRCVNKYRTFPDPLFCQIFALLTPWTAVDFLLTTALTTNQVFYLLLLRSAVCDATFYTLYSIGPLQLLL